MRLPSVELRTDSIYTIKCKWMYNLCKKSKVGCVGCVCVCACVCVGGGAGGEGEEVVHDVAYIIFVVNMLFEKGKKLQN